MSKSIVSHTPGDLEVRFDTHLSPVNHSDRPIGASSDYCENAAMFAHVVCTTVRTRGVQFSEKVARANADRIALTWNCHDDMLAALQAMSAHYSGSLDHQPAYVKMGRAAIARATGVAP